MSRKRGAFWIVLFMMMLILPSVLSPILSPFLRTDNSENRKLAEKPQLSIGEIEEFSSKYESYYNDRLPFRSQLIEANSLLSYYLFQSSSNEGVVLGKEQWLFLNGDNVIEDYKRKISFSEEEKSNILKRLWDIEQELSLKGMKTIFLIPPNKEEIYGESFLPSYYSLENHRSKSSRTEELVDYIKDKSDLTILYPKEEMKKYSQQYRLYYKNDTHWNLLGSYIAEQQILEALYGERGYLESEKIIKGELEKHESADMDMANMLKLGNYLSDPWEYGIERYPLPEDWSQQINQEGNHERDDKVMLIGDSFRIALLPYLRQDFREFSVIMRGTEETKRLEEYAPDIVIIECVERFSEKLGTEEIILK